MVDKLDPTLLTDQGKSGGAESAGIPKTPEEAKAIHRLAIRKAWPPKDPSRILIENAAQSRRNTSDLKERAAMDAARAESGIPPVGVTAPSPAPSGENKG